MPVADYKTYCKMLDRAMENKFAYPAINVTSLTTANAVLKGLAESRCDGIIQVSTGGGAFASGSSIKDMALGAASIAEHVHRVAKQYDIYVALHTDHCQADKLDTFVIPLIEETEKRRAAGMPNLFNSHMFDGSALPLKENLDLAVPLLERCHRNEIILEIEVGVVGGEEDTFAGRADRHVVGVLRDAEVERRQEWSTAPVVVVPAFGAAGEDAIAGGEDGEEPASLGIGEALPAGPECAGVDDVRRERLHVRREESLTRGVQQHHHDVVW